MLDTFAVPSVRRVPRWCVGIDSLGEHSVCNGVPGFGVVAITGPVGQIVWRPFAGVERGTIEFLVERKGVTLFGRRVGWRIRRVRRTHPG
jgi:hypothetical protein